MFITKRRFLAVLGSFLAAPAWAAKKPYWSTRATGFAADGADVVAYHGLKGNAKAVEGKNDFVVSWKGGRFRFANRQTMAAFQANPKKYAPRFGGYCALSVAFKGNSTGDKHSWHIHQGRLYLNGSKKVRRRWRKSINKHIRLAEQNWPAVLDA